MNGNGATSDISGKAQGSCGSGPARSNARAKDNGSSDGELATGGNSSNGSVGTRAGVIGSEVAGMGECSEMGLAGRAEGMGNGSVGNGNGSTGIVGDEAAEMDSGRARGTGNGLTGISNGDMAKGSRLADRSCSVGTGRG